MRTVSFQYDVKSPSTQFGHVNLVTEHNAKQWQSHKYKRLYAEMLVLDYTAVPKEDPHFDAIVNTLEREFIKLV